MAAFNWKRGALYDLSSSPSQKKQRLDFISDALTAVGQPEAAGYVEGVSDFIDELGGDQLVPAALSGIAPPSSKGRVSSSQMGRYRRSGRRRRRGRRSKASPWFTKKTGSALLKLKPTKRFLDATSETTFSAGDGTSRTLYIAAPVANIPTNTHASGTENTDELWIKAIKIRGRISLDQTTNSIRCRMLVLWSKQFADLPTSWTVYGNTTTALTNPTQTAADLEGNLRIFETSDAEELAAPNTPYTGNVSGIDIIDNNLVKVLGGREWFLSQQHLLNFINFDLYVPINRKWKMYTEFGEISSTDQKRSHTHGNYYVIFQVFSNTNANNILAAQDVLMTNDMIVYFKTLI